MLIEESKGGTITLQDDKGNRISLEIPPNALKESTDITLTLLDAPPPNPYSLNLYPGINIIPDGLRLKSPATLCVNFTSSISNPELSSLFYLKRPDLAMPVYRIEASNEKLSSHIFHLSTFIAAQPTLSEVTNQVEKLELYLKSRREKWNVGDVSESFFNFMDDIRDMMELAERVELLGGSNPVDQMLGNLKNQIENNIETLLNEVPKDPCGLYLLTLLNYDKIVTHFYTSKELMEGMAHGGFQTENRIFKHRANILRNCIKDPLENTEWGFELTGVQTGYSGGEKIDLKVTGKFKIRGTEDTNIQQIDGKSHFSVSWKNTTGLCTNSIHGGVIIGHPTNGTKKYDVDIDGFAGWGQVNLHFRWIMAEDRARGYTHICEERNARGTISESPHYHFFHIILPLIVPSAGYDPPKSFPNDWVRKAVLQSWHPLCKTFLIQMKDGTYTWNHNTYSGLSKYREIWLNMQRAIGEFDNKPNDVSVSSSFRLWRISS